MNERRMASYSYIFMWNEENIEKYHHNHIEIECQME